MISTGHRFIELNVHRAIKNHEILKILRDFKLFYCIVAIFYSTIKNPDDISLAGLWIL